mmetsp:Transcript_13810/g.39529  ORF Transcript_13810/g.39529 Transcript_13810/m.39529 type:complete len:205 (+) Transcript_13810:36-650(+)
MPAFAGILGARSALCANSQWFRRHAHGDSCPRHHAGPFGTSNACRARPAAMPSSTWRCSTFCSRLQHLISTASLTKSPTRRSAKGWSFEELLRSSRARSCAHTEPGRGASTESVDPSPAMAASSDHRIWRPRCRNCSVAALAGVAASSPRGSAAAQCMTSWLTSPNTLWLKGQMRLSSAPGGTGAPVDDLARHQPWTLDATSER